MASFNNEYSDTVVTGTNGNDYIHNGGNNVTIYGGKGSDTVVNQTIYNTETHRHYGENVTISGGDGNDDIYGNGDSVDGGAGNDTIYNTSAKTTIIGGTGDDSIRLADDWKSRNPERLIKYRAGDGNDTIIGINPMDTVAIAASSYSSVRSGNDIIVKVGDGSITLVDGMNRSVYIETVEPAHDLTTEGDDSINNTIDGAIINALGGKDTITNSGENVSINGGDGNDLVNNNAAQNVTINTAEGNDTIKLGSAVKSFKVENFGAGDVISLATAVDSLETVSGGIKAGNVTISGITNVAKTTSSWQTSSNFISRVSSTSAGAKVSGKKITYDTTSNSSTLFTITGLSSTIGVSLSGTTVTLTEAALANRTSDTITISDGYTLALATNVDTIKEELAGGWTTLSSGNVAYLAGGTGSYYSLSGGNKITYNASVVGGDNMVELRGVKGTPTLSGTNVSLAADNFASDVSVVSNAGDYSFYLKGDLKGKKFTGGAGNDDIENWGDSVSIDGGKGDDSINNLDAASVTINGGDGNDLILNIGSSVTMDGGAGSDIIQNLYGDNAIINGGGGNDVLRNYSPNASINGDAGNDHIYNEGSNVIIDGGAGDDGVVNYGNETSIVGGTGNDTICNNGYIEDDGSFYHYDDSLGYAENVLFKYSSGDGNDIIYGFKESSTLSISGGEFSSVKSGDDIIVTVGDGKISLMGAASLSTVNIAGTVKKSFTLSEGNDTYCNTLADATIQALGGNDSIYNCGGKRVSISGGNGDDTIYNTYAPRQSGSPLLPDPVLLDDDYVTSESISSSSTDTVSDEDYSPDKATLLGGAGKDVIYNIGANVLIEGGTGNDEISLSSDAKNNLIQYSSGDGNDTIWGFRADSTLQIGDGSGTYAPTQKSGNDIIVKVGESKITLVDAAKLSKVNIKGIKKEAALMASNKTANMVIAGTTENDEIINRAKNSTILGGGGDDTLTNMRKNNVKLAGDDGDDVLENSDGSNVTIEGGAGNDDIYSDGDDVSIDGGDGDDSIYVKAATDVTIKGGTGNDDITLKAASNTLIQYAEGDGNDLIQGFNETTTLQIGNGTTDTYFGKTSGSDVIITVGDEQITLKGAGDFETVKERIAGTFVDKTLTVTVKAVTLSGSYEIADASKRTAATKIVGNALDNSILGGSNKDSLYGEAGDDSINGNAGADKLYGGGGSDTIDGGAGNDAIYGEADDDSLSGGAGSDYLNGGDGDDTLDGGTGTNTLAGGNGADTFIYSGGKDVISDYVSGEDIISLGTTFSDSITYSFDGNDGNNVVFKIGTGTLTIKNAKGKTLSFIDSEDTSLETIPGFEFFNNDSPKTNTLKTNTIFADATKRTTAIKIVGNSMNSSIMGGTGADTLDGGDGSDTIDSGAGNDSIYGEAGDDSINGNAGADKLYGGGGSDTIEGGAGSDAIYGEADDDSLSGGAGSDYLSGGDGDDTLDGGTGTNTLAGGNGADTFIYSGGKDTISDYIAGEDVISISAATFADITKATVSGSDVVLTFGAANKTLTIKKARSIPVTLVDSTGADTIIGPIPLDNDTESPYTLKDSVTAVDATNRELPIQITGNDLSNTIAGGTGNDTLLGANGTDSLYGNAGSDSLDGGNGDDTIWGGKGNDSLTGGNGDDVFIYTGGKDVITDYAEGDKISIGAAFSKATLSGNNVVFTVSNQNKLTVKDAKYKEMLYIDKDGTEHVTMFGGVIYDDDSDSAVTLGVAVDVGSAKNRKFAIQITGNEWNNTILGGAGADTLYGLDGYDSLHGADGDDKLDGGKGNDTLWGGKGNDTLIGGDGSDTFVYNAGDGKDVIMSFDEDDKLELNGVNIGDITASIKSSALVLSIDNSNSITFKSYDGPLNINGEFYEYKSGNRLVKQQ